MQDDQKIPEEKKKLTKEKVKHEVLDWIKSIAFALVIVFIIRFFLFTIVKVDGNSMETTLHNGERLFVTVADVRFGDVDRNSVVICHYPGRGLTYFVKRVVAVPGDQVRRANGVTYVIYENESGETVEEALDPMMELVYPNGSDDDYAAYTLGDGEYFVVGDNRYNSHDSRDWNDGDSSKDVGPIRKSMISGRVRCVFFPFGAARGVS